MRALISTASSLLLIAATTLACSSEPSDDGGEDTTGGTGQGGSSGASTGGASMGGASTGGSTTGGSAGTGTTGGASGASTGGSGGSGVTGGSGGSTGTTKSGICVQKGESNVTTTEFEGVEEFYLISEEAVDDGRTDAPAPGDLLCHIRFNVTRSGDAVAGCADLDGVPCDWAHDVVYSNPTVINDADGVCARSQIAWTMAWIDSVDGSTESYGYIPEYEGHQSVAMRYSKTAMQWATFGRGFWDETTTLFEFSNTLGPCTY